VNDYPKWEGRPACEGIDTELFFTEGTYSNLPMLRRICNNCPVMQQCFDYSVTHAVSGYWANTTEKQREGYRKLHNIIAKPLVPLSLYETN
jgi:hypothetical protein